MRNWLFLLVLVVTTQTKSCGDGQQYALVQTTQGDIKIMLYNETPLHRDNFVKLVKEGFYDDLLFHRVIPGFMIQGGDPESKGAEAGQALGMGGTGYKIPSEKGFPHIRGTLAAAKKGNEAESSGCQFYITIGQSVGDPQLDAVEQRFGIKYTEDQRMLYKSLGGTPHLDMVHTVFGEVVEGMDVVERIANQPRNRSNRPNEDVVMRIKMVKK